MKGDSGCKCYCLLKMKSYSNNEQATYTEIHTDKTYNAVPLSKF